MGSKYGPLVWAFALVSLFRKALKYRRILVYGIKSANEGSRAGAHTKIPRADGLDFRSRWGPKRPDKRKDLTYWFQGPISGGHQKSWFVGSLCSFSILYHLL